MIDRHLIRRSTTQIIENWLRVMDWQTYHRFIRCPALKSLNYILVKDDGGSDGPLALQRPIEETFGMTSKDKCKLLKPDRWSDGLSFK